METAARLLRLLVLVSSRGTWSAHELAERLGVTTRTLRRDVIRLRDLGYPVESVTGPHGGYSLGRGGRLPPLLFDDDEAVATVIGLRRITASPESVLADDAVSALTKIAQVLPDALRDRVEVLEEMTVGLDWPRRPATTDHPTADPVEGTPDSTGGSVSLDPGSLDPVSLMDVAVACRRRERARFDYRRADGTGTARHTEPHRLVASGSRWYLVAFDLDRDDWRTFRIDRMRRWRPTGAPAATRAAPDAAELVAEGIALAVFTLHADVRFGLPAEQVARIVHPTIGVIDHARSDATSTIVRIGGEPDWIARYVLSLPCDAEVLGPDEVRHAVADRARTVIRRHGPRPIDRRAGRRAVPGDSVH